MIKNKKNRILASLKWRSLNQERWKAYMRMWRKSHVNQIKKNRKKYYETHRERENEQATKWQKDHKFRTAASWKASSAKKRYPGALVVEDVLEILKRDKMTCHWCGRANLNGRNLTLEHLKPFNSKKSIVVACLSCNCKKLHIGK